MGDKTRGLYGKFAVKRMDGSSAPGGEHAKCFHYVLDLDHDPYAVPALKAYADACREEYPLLAADIDNVIVRKAAQTTVDAHSVTWGDWEGTVKDIGGRWWWSLRFQGMQVANDVTETKSKAVWAIRHAANVTCSDGLSIASWGIGDGHPVGEGVGEQD